MPVSPRRGQIWQANLGQGVVIPGVIIQSEAAEVVGTTIIVPLTDDTQKADLATSVLLVAATTNLERNYVALCPQLRVLSVSKLQELLGTLTEAQLREIEQVLAFLLGLPA